MLHHRALVVVALVTATACISYYYVWRSSAVPVSGQSKAIHKPASASTQTSPLVAAQAEKLRGAYFRMAADFAAQGLDVASIAAQQSWFHGMKPGEMTWPKRYDQMDPPFPADSVRILVIPLEDCPAIASQALAATAKVAALLPEGTKVFANSRTQYHVTVFHSSHPVDTRPDPLSPSGGLGTPPGAPHERAAVTQSMLDRESQAISQVVGGVRPPELEADSLVMTRSGTLLLTWVDRTGRLAELRKNLMTAFPGATSKQSSIIHTSLLRVVSPEALPPETTATIAHMCTQLTDTLKGRTFTPSSLWWVRESEFSTVVGPREIVKPAQ